MNEHNFMFLLNLLKRDIFAEFSPLYNRLRSIYWRDILLQYKKEAFSNQKKEEKCINGTLIIKIMNIYWQR